MAYYPIPVYTPHFDSTEAGIGYILGMAIIIGSIIAYDKVSNKVRQVREEKERKVRAKREAEYWDRQPSWDELNEKHIESGNSLTYGLFMPMHDKRRQHRK